MNEKNSLETQLLSWSPRRPSPKLKGRIFGGEAASPDSPWMIALSRFAPATAVVVLLMASLNGHNSPNVYLSDSDLGFAAISLSNQSPSSHYPAPDACDRNSPPMLIFASTNGGRSPSSIGSFLAFGTNTLLH